MNVALQKHTVENVEGSKRIQGRLSNRRVYLGISTLTLTIERVVNSIARKTAIERRP